MNNNFWTRVAIAVAAVIVFTIPTYAKKAPSATLNVPFAFVAGNHTLPAGTYKVEMLTSSKAGQDEVEVVVLRGMDVHAYAAVVAGLDRANEQAPLMRFRQGGDKPVLAELRVAGKSLNFNPSTSQLQYAENSTSQDIEVAEQTGNSPVIGNR